MRRGNGEGSVFKLGGKRRRPWAVRITAGWTEEGKQILKYLSYHSTKAEAKAALREYLVDPYDITASKITLKEVFERWEKSTTISQRTFDGYSRIFKRISQLHDLPMSNIKVAHIEEAMNDFTPSNQRTLKNTLNQLYNYALKHEIVDKNIISLITVKDGEAKKESTPFTLEQIKAIKNFGHAYTDTALILLYTGMRINELLEIENKNVFLDKRYMIGGLKTAAGKNRVIPIHDDIYDLIKARYNPDNKYLIHVDSEKPMTYLQYRRNFWNVLQDNFGFKQTPHDTRHTFITFADKCNLNRLSVQRIVGHKAGEITDHYTHRTIEELITEINKLKYE